MRPEPDLTTRDVMLRAFWHAAIGGLIGATGALIISLCADWQPSSPLADAFVATLLGGFLGLCRVSLQVQAYLKQDK